MGRKNDSYVCSYDFFVISYGLCIGLERLMVGENIKIKEDEVIIIESPRERIEIKCMMGRLMIKREK